MIFKITRMYWFFIDIHCRLLLESRVELNEIILQNSFLCCLFHWSWLSYSFLSNGFHQNHYELIWIKTIWMHEIDDYMHPNVPINHKFIITQSLVLIKGHLQVSFCIRLWSLEMANYFNITILVLVLSFSTYTVFILLPDVLQVGL